MFCVSESHHTRFTTECLTTSLSFWPVPHGWLKILGLMLYLAASSRESVRCTIATGAARDIITTKGHNSMISAARLRPADTTFAPSGGFGSLLSSQ